MQIPTTTGKMGNPMNTKKFFGLFERSSLADVVVAICAVIALWQIILLRETNKNAQENAAKQMRAYVVVDDCQIIGYGGEGQPYLALTIINSGQTPAYEINIKDSFLMIGDEKMPFHKIGQGTLASQQKHVFMSPVPLDDKPKIQDKDKPLHLTGKIFYKDNFNVEHKTSFNYVLLYRDMASKAGTAFLFPAEEGNESN